MEMKQSVYQILLSVVFILFWLYSAGFKLYDFGAFKQEMHRQVFPAELSNLLSFTVPASEIIIAALLVNAVTRGIGMILSFLLMLAFTTYTGLALLGVYSTTPCNCIGLLGEKASWGDNFMLNLVITLIATAGLILTFKDWKGGKRV
ncbi:MauE/DoxX family redox-associated membrane protein [Pedobacter caeni]|uniref:Methylamine utilisation protein MauE domain-containing protein n=1 Tax=Pedobacter caeni TaxID=288992 RepID=A0A1M4TQ70_9SPHI|nr:MauE/DoxX family redox-associated membrane protein [Pedobacter caeni]SHE46535.1 hypothetical protein SAMN04488522_101275 [Pedobacter caeni]